MKFFRYIGRSIREGFAYLSRHFAMSLSAIVTVSLTIFLVGFFALVSSNVAFITANIEDGVQMHVKVTNDATSENILSLSEKIAAIDGVLEIDISDKENELNKLIESYGEQGELFRVYAGDANPLRNALLIRFNQGADLELISNKIKQLEFVEEVNYGGEGTLILMDMIRTLQKVVLIIACGLSVVALFLIANTIKVTILSRRTEIEIMKNVGAKNGYIRAPFVIHGILIGVLGSAIPVAFYYFGYAYLFQQFNGVLFSQMFALIPPIPFTYYVSALLSIAGILVGFVGSYISVTKHLWWIR